MSIDKITPLDTFVSNDAPICYGILKPGDHYKHGIPVIKVKNIVGGKILEDDLLKTTPEIHAQYKRAEVKEGDILLTIRGTTGRVAIVPNSLNGANITQDTARIRVSSNDDSLYIFYALQSFNVQQQITLNTVGQAVKGINIAEVKKLKIYHPILDEQKKIAQILSTWDQAILTTEKLLENSQQQKKALMQQLLTGKKRLHDENSVEFSEEWKTLSLDSLFIFKKGKGLSKDSISESGQNKCILYGELYTKYPEVIDEIVSKTNSSEATLSMKGDILIPSSTTTSGIDLANATALLEENVLLGGDINILRPKGEFSSEFMAYLLTHIKKYEIASRAQGITIIHLYGSDLKDIEVKIPVKVEEQEKIAKLLSIVEKKINALQGKIVCLKKEKKALMQQLLTGKKRVKVAA